MVAAKGLSPVKREAGFGPPKGRGTGSFGGVRERLATKAGGAKVAPNVKPPADPSSNWASASERALA